MHTLTRSLIALALVASMLPLASSATAQTDGTALTPARRETEPVVLTGERFPQWSAAADVALEGPTANGGRCQLTGHDDPGNEPCTHNRYEDPDLQSSDLTEREENPVKGVPVDRLLGYRWNPDLGDDGGFEQIPFQVDEMFVRYLSNNNSGFAFYSETDQHTAYAFDREGFRWLGDHRDDPDYAGDPMAPCLAKPTSEVAKDPVQGLDTDDELAFMYDDSGAQAPASALLPSGVQDSYEVALADPTNPGTITYAYVMLAGPEGPDAAFDRSNGYVRYERDDPEGRNMFLFSESSYENYGATQKGPVAERDPSTGEWVCNAGANVQRRPSDAATITTPRYRFRYEGRWLMTELHVSDEAINGERFQDLTTPLPEDWYGPDVVDQWKARAFQQRPSGNTPCCGYEEEVNNWGGSSILMGERSGPVRVIRETWGADSGTNVVRREIFYRDEIRFGSFLRVHVIPPLDGIYAQWDYNAGRVDTYYNSVLTAQGREEGVAIDGQNDEVFGNSRVHVGRDGVSYDGNDTVSDALDEATGEEEQKLGNPNEPNCDYPGQPLEEQYDSWKQQLPERLREEMPGDAVDLCVYNDIDSPDPAFSGVNAGLNWEEIAGDHGTLVLRSAIKQFTPGGAVQGLAAVPYYRDDSCFDDGTGTNPGRHLNGRSADTGEFTRYEGEDRRCWTPQDGLPAGDSDSHFWQGSIGTHGIHILLIADSDNAHTPLPLTEIDSEQRMVVLPGDQGNVGDAYGRAPEKPLVVTAAAETRQTQPAETKEETSLDITGPTSGQITDAVRLEATLTSGGEPVVGKEIVFTLDGEEVGRGETDGAGVAGAEVTLAGPARETEQGAAFAEDGSHLGSSATAPFSVLLDDSVLELSVGDGKEPKPGKTRPTTATLTDADARTGLAGRTIRFLLNGEQIGTAVTDDQGIATLEATFGKSRNSFLRAVFDGDDSYSGSRSEAKPAGA